MKNIKDKFSSIPKWLIFAFVILAFIGFTDSFYLTVSHFQGSDLNCNILDGCDLVTSSKYATWGPVPVALIGAIYYLAAFFFSLTYITNKKERFLEIAMGLSGLGFFASFWFVILQVFIIEALCLYCMISALTSTLLFIFAIMIIRRKERSNKK